MGTLDQQIQTALSFLPEHRARSKRSQTLHLDLLLEGYRKQNQLDPGTLDLILMAYRWNTPFEESLVHFFKDKKPKFSPPPLKDLWQILFASLISRDKTPAHALVNTGVECSRRLFGERTTSITNAYLRTIGREKDQIIETISQNPALILPTKIRERWRSAPDLIARSSRLLHERPNSGFYAFTEDGILKRVTSNEIIEQDKMQAMDIGSWDFINWVVEKISAQNVPVINLLDACSAPGGKLIALKVLAKIKGGSLNKIAFHATEAKFRRFEILKKNLHRWDFDQDVFSRLHAWGLDDPQTMNRDLPKKFDFILADLPCTGAGTLHTRPDQLLGDLFSKLRSVKTLQLAILEDLKTRLAPKSTFVVSICSVDPDEISHISAILKCEPEYSSWNRVMEPCEGITAWLVKS